MKNIFKQIADLKAEGKIVGFTASTFDLLHAGHIIMLNEAKTQCDYLIVGLLTDPTRDRPNKNYPIQTSWERWLQAQAIKAVDTLIPFDTEEDLEMMIRILKPNVRFVGEEYKNSKHTGYDIKGVKIIYNKREHNYGSTQLRKKIYKQEDKKNLAQEVK
jgi:glycerol-3-phosphate cytidylyltransferase